MRIVVVGAGIVGAAVAYHCAKAGAEVVLLDKALPASGVTADSFAWIGGPRAADPPDPSTPLRRLVGPDYRRLEQEVPGVRVHWRGALTWGDAESGEVPAGPGERVLDAAAAGRLEPHLRDRPVRAVHLGSHGAVDPVAVTQALVRAARDHGARLEPHCAVIALAVGEGPAAGVPTVRGQAVGVTAAGVTAVGVTAVGVRTSTGTLPADAVVVTAGVDAPPLCAPLGFDLPVRPSPALLMRFTAPPGLVRTLVAAPHLEVREAADGHLLVAAGYHGEITPADLRRTGEEMLRRLTATFDAPQVELVDVRVGTRPMPADGLPVIGPVPGAGAVYVAVTHSGVTLAPTIGRLVAAEIVGGRVAEPLAGLRPARFAGR